MEPDIPETSNVGQVQEENDRLVTSEETTQSILNLIKELSFGEKNRIRANITNTREAVYFDYQEARAVRISASPPPGADPHVFPNGDTKPATVPLYHIVNMFYYGSLRQYNQHVTGVVQIGINLFRVTFKSDVIADDIINRYSNETTGRGSDDEQVFQFYASDFKDPIKNLTFFPIPTDFSEENLKELIEKALQIGDLENVSWGKHKETQALNGFVHARVRTKKDSEIPDRVYINKKCVTILRDNEKLYRPCPLCQMRNHAMQSCPSIFHFKDFALEKQKRKQDEAEQEMARKAQREEEIRRIKQQLLNNNQQQNENTENNTIINPLFPDLAPQQITPTAPPCNTIPPQEVDILGELGIDDSITTSEVATESDEEYQDLENLIGAEDTTMKVSSSSLTDNRQATANVDFSSLQSTPPGSRRSPRKIQPKQKNGKSQLQKKVTKKNAKQEAEEKKRKLATSPTETISKALKTGAGFLRKGASNSKSKS